MSYYACVIVNPASANGATGRHWPEIRAALDRVLGRWDHQFSLGPGDATRLASEAVDEGYDMVVSVGGDGTMNEVVTGLFEADDDGRNPRLRRDDMVLATVRAGTGGDFARLLKLSNKLPENVGHLQGDAVRPCDVGWVEYTGHEGEPQGRGFLNIASFGMSGLVDEKVNKTTKLFGGKASFFAGTLRALASYKAQAVTVTVDGERFVDEPMETLAVANGQFFGGGMHFAPNAEIDDGQFDVVVQMSTGINEVLSVAKLYNGRFLEWDTVRHRRGALIEATSADPSARVLLDVDGEQPGHLPATFRMFPSAVRLKVR